MKDQSSVAQHVVYKSVMKEGGSFKAGPIKADVIRSY